MKPDADYFLYSSEMQALGVSNAVRFTIVASEEKVFISQPLQHHHDKNVEDIDTDIKECSWL